MLRILNEPPLPSLFPFFLSSFPFFLSFPTLLLYSPSLSPFPCPPLSLLSHPPSLSSYSSSPALLPLSLLYLPAVKEAWRRDGQDDWP